MTSERIPYTQSGRMMAVETKLGEDQLLLHHLEVDERVNALFEIQAAVKAQRDDLAAGDLIGSSVDFRVKLLDGGTRWWNGFVTGMHEGSLTTRGTRSYAMTVRPRLWLLSQRSDCRIWLGQTTQQVIETLLSEHGISDHTLRITQKLVARDYSVQWNETDLDFMLRRMQQDGLAYWFEQAQGKHTLIVGDHYSSYGKAPEAEVRYAEGSAAQDHIHDWRRSFAFTPGKRAARDWNWLSMQAPGAEQRTFAQVPGNADHELYEYPGRFDDSVSADQATKMRIQATESGFETVEAASTVRTLGPGQTFTPIDVAKPQNTFAKQVVTAIRHVATDPTYETGGGMPTYDNTFTVIPATTIATPHRYQRRPRINGQQVALIAGPSGEEIFTNQYGQVKVWFPWDRRAKKDGTDTVWIRVGQPWAGTTWGHQVIPRVGMECLVSYQEGDPDRPFIMALVPDPTNPVPYTLPDNKTRMVMRSNTYKGSGYNEISLEDYSGKENLFTHAQKDMTTKVLNNTTSRTDANTTESIGQNHSFEVGQNSSQQVGGSMSLTVGAVGGAASSALSAAMSGISGQTAGLLQSAMGVAMQAMSGASGSGGSPDASSASPAGMISQAVSGALGGSNPAASSSTTPAAGSSNSTSSPDLSSLASGFKGLIGSGAIGGLLAGGVDAARTGVNDATNLAQVGGTGMASSGSDLSSLVGQMMGGAGGTLNTLVSQFQNNTTGMASTEQVGMTKVMNVGQVLSENIGNTKKVMVGEELIVEVGQSLLIMKKDGTILLKGVNIEIEASGIIQEWGKVIHMN